MSNQELYNEAVKAIDNLFADQSVDIPKAIENLEELQSDIEGKLDCLNEDLKREEENDDE
jgi:hypothetical protein